MVRIHEGEDEGHTPVIVHSCLHLVGIGSEYAAKGISDENHHRTSTLKLFVQPEMGVSVDARLVAQRPLCEAGEAGGTGLQEYRKVLPRITACP